MPSSIQQNVERARERIALALERSGRGDAAVTLVGVTKTMGPERVEELIRAGVEDIGENRVQEFLDKSTQVTLPCRWHLIGTLQRNKAARAVGSFVLIHSLDSLKLAGTLSRLSVERGEVTRVLLEVNISGESTKHGFSPEELEECAGASAELPGLDLSGLMTIGPFTDDTGKQRRAFRRLFELREGLEHSLSLRLPELSMGMSSDFEIAVEEGATMVRLGRVLMGERG